MKICKENHREVCFDADQCPACAALTEKNKIWEAAKAAEVVSKKAQADLGRVRQELANTRRILEDTQKELAACRGKVPAETAAA